MFGLTWSLELYQQTNARLWRQGQSETVTIHHIICKDTVDEDVMAALEKKDITQEKLIAAVKARYIECNGLWQVQNCGHSWFQEVTGRRGRLWMRRTVERRGYGDSEAHEQDKKEQDTAVPDCSELALFWQNPMGRCSRTVTASIGA